VAQMNKLCSTLLSILFVLLVVVAQPATATAIPVGSVLADDVIFNFDFRLSAPPPPYAQVTIRATFAGGSPSNQIYGDVFGGLNGTGGLTATNPGVSPVSYFALAMADIPSTADGVFSVGLRLDGGVATIATFTATACNALGSCVELDGIPMRAPGSSAHPVPALSGLGRAVTAILLVAFCAVFLRRRTVG
jgi:hypothetical protein